MEFSESAIDEFIEIYERTFKESIPRDDAIQMARRLVNMYRLFLTRPEALRHDARSQQPSEDTDPSGSQAS